MKAVLLWLWMLGVILAQGFAQRPLESQTVTRVVDGDTVYLSGYRESFRLIGIDTPESRNNSRAREAAARTGKDLKIILAQGKLAKEFVTTMLKGKLVSIEWDVQRRDRYGRNLAYLILNGKNSSVEIARAGFADALTIPPNVRYSSQIVAAVAMARAAKRGLWR
jgi:micrococcal nuclease